MLAIKIVLTPEQREQLKPLREALGDKGKLGGVGSTIGQLGGEGSFEIFDSNFTCAGFTVLDHEAATKVNKLIRKERKRMALEAARLTAVAEFKAANAEAATENGS
jgi:hypothetical protein